MNLKQKVAVVTGTSNRLGAAFASALVTKGTKVYGLAGNLDKLNTLQKQLGFGTMARNDQH